MTQTKQQLFIPFSGFYCSMHDEAIDHEFNSIFSDHATGCNINEHLQSAANLKTDFIPVFEKYAEKYTSLFCHAVNLDGISFAQLHMPREYNFQTDRILCNITQETIRRLVRQTAPEVLKKVCRERHTSRDGFISFYDPDYTTWGPVREWDNIQLESLFLAWLETNGHDVQNIEFSVLEDIECNGHLSNWLYDVIPERFIRIHEYIETRKARKAA